MHLAISCISGIGMSLFLMGAAHAGPPYVTDDPEPTDQGHWEIYQFVGATHVPGDTAGAGGLDLNYGGAKDLQLTMVLPVEFERTNRTSVGLGDVELAAKFKVLHEDGPTGLDVAVFPRLFLPTANSRHANRRASLLLPIYAGRDIGPWSVFGGGGYVFASGPEDRSYWQGGLAVTRAVGERWSLGAEAYARQSDAHGGHAFAGVGLGATYRVAPHWSLLASIGPGIKNAGAEGRYTAYAAVLETF